MQGTFLTDRQRQFAEDNHRLIYSFLQRYNFAHDEWYGVAAIGFCKAVKAFDAKRNKAFSTFAYHVMLNEVLMEMRKAQAPKRKATLVSLQSEVCDGCTLEDVLAIEVHSAENSSVMDIMDFIHGMKIDQQLIIASLAAGETQNEIAYKMSVSQPQVSRTIKAIRVMFRNEFLNGIGCAGKTPAPSAYMSGEGAVHV